MISRHNVSLHQDAAWPCMLASVIALTTFCVIVSLQGLNVSSACFMLTLAMVASFLYVSPKQCVISTFYLPVGIYCVPTQLLRLFGTND